MDFESIAVKKKGKKYVFVIPQDKAEKIQKEYKFSIEQLSVGGDIPLAELAVHIDEQASLEANVAQACEIAKYKLNILKDEFEYWEITKLQKCRRLVQADYARATEANIKGFFLEKHGKAYREKKIAISDLEFQYRMLKVFQDAIRKKGDLLPTLRNIVQGKADGIGAIGVEVSKKTRRKIKV